MARLGIDDQFWLEIAGVIAAVGDQDKAIGNAVRWFRFAQEKHKKGLLVTEAEFKKNGFSEALFPLFAERTPSGIECAGAKKHFAWLEQKIKAGSAGGKKSATQPRSKGGQFGPQIKITPSDRRPSPSPSYSLTDSDSQNTPTESQKTSGFIAGYCARFKSKYGFNTKVAGKNAGIAKRVFENIPAGKLDQYLDAFFEMPDAELVKAKHPLAKFEFKFNEVAVFAEKRAFTPRAQASDVDREQADQLKEARERREREEALQGVFGGPMLIGGGDAG